MNVPNRGKRVLGLDLGPNSLGWAILRLNGSDGEIERLGVRVFEAGLDSLENDGKGNMHRLRTDDHGGIGACL